MTFNRFAVTNKNTPVVDKNKQLNTLEAVVQLQPCKIRETRIIPDTEKKISLNWEEYKKLLAPSQNIVALMVLRKATVGSYIGLLNDRKGNLINFIYAPNNTSESVAPLLKKIPELPNRLHSFYKILSADFGSRFKE